MCISLFDAILARYMYRITDKVVWYTCDSTDKVVRYMYLLADKEVALSIIVMQ